MFIHLQQTLYIELVCRWAVKVKMRYLPCPQIVQFYNMKKNCKPTNILHCYVEPMFYLTLVEKLYGCTHPTWLDGRMEATEKAKQKNI